MEEKLNELSFINAALFGFLIAFAYYIMFFHPSDPTVELERIENDMVQVKGDVAKLDREIKEGQKVQEEISVMMEKAKQAYIYIPENFVVAEATSIISSEARLAGLSIQSITAGGSWSARETVAVAEVSAAVVGTYSQGLVLLSELSRKDKVYSVDEITISNNDRSNDKDLNFNIKFAIFKRLKDKKPGEEGGRL